MTGFSQSVTAGRELAVPVDVVVIAVVVGRRPEVVVSDVDVVEDVVVISDTRSDDDAPSPLSQATKLNSIVAASKSAHHLRINIPLFHFILLMSPYRITLSTKKKVFLQN